jgi:hypothetical protein
MALFELLNLENKAIYIKFRKFIFIALLNSYEIWLHQCTIEFINLKTSERPTSVIAKKHV